MLSIWAYLSGVSMPVFDIAPNLFVRFDGAQVAVAATFVRKFGRADTGAF